MGMEKKCIKCNKNKPIEEFVFNKKINYYTNICLECNKIYHQAYYNNRKNKVKDIQPILNNDTKKVCNKCKEEKTLESFSYDKVNGKFVNICKDCKAEATKKWREKNKEKAKISAKEYQKTHKKQIDEYQAKYRIENAEKRRAYSRKYNKDNKEVIKIKRRIYREKHKEEFRERDKKYAEEHKEEIKTRYKEWAKEHAKQLAEYNKKYRMENAETIREKKKQYSKEHVKERTQYYLNKRAIDPLFKLSTQVRGLIRISLKKKGYTKNSSTYEILGCDYETLMMHLKESWLRRYGKEWDGEPYHVDHIIPLAVAKTEQEVLDLCYYKNLQMLTPHDNLVKNKYMEEQD